MALDMSGLQRFQAGVTGAIDAGAKQGAEYIGDLAQQLAPEDQGDLKASKQVKPGEQPGEYVVSFGEGLPDERATAQEFGTIYMDAQPYMAPATEAIDVKAEIKGQLADLAARSRI